MKCIGRFNYLYDFNIFSFVLFFHQDSYSKSFLITIQMSKDFENRDFSWNGPSFFCTLVVRIFKRIEKYFDINIVDVRVRTSRHALQFSNCSRLSSLTLRFSNLNLYSIRRLLIIFDQLKFRFYTWYNGLLTFS